MPIRENLLIFQLAVIQFTHIVDFMIMMPLGKQFMELYGVSPQQFSMLVSAYAGMAFVAGLAASLYIDRFDRRDALLFLYTGFILGTFGCGLADSYHLLLLARSFTGAFGGVLGALVLAIVADVVPLERRGAAMGKIMLAFSTASIFGVPAGIYLAARHGIRLPFLAIASISTVFFFLAWYSVPKLRAHLQPTASPKAPAALVSDLTANRNQLLALLFSFVLVVGHFAIIPFIAPYMEMNIGFTADQVALLYAIGGTVTVVFMPLFGYLGDRFGHIRIFSLASIGALASIYLVTNLTTVPLWIALLVSASFFMVASGRNIPATTLITSVVQPANRGSFMSIRASFNEAALAISSFVAGLLITKHPDGSLGNYEQVGYLAIGMSIVAIFLARKLKMVA
ncbi:MAG: MFS transporter [Bacteroidota bacterium]